MSRNNGQEIDKEEEEFAGFRRRKRTGDSFLKGFKGSGLDKSSCKGEEDSGGEPSASSGVASGFTIVILLLKSFEIAVGTFRTIF